MRILRWILGGLGLLVFVGAILVESQIGWSNVIGMLRYDTRREGDLKVGDLAPPVVLHAAEDGAPVRLFDAPPKRPVVLIFGSFT